MKVRCLLCLIMFLGGCVAQDATADQWHKLIDSKNKDAAQKLCTGFLASPDAKTVAEGHKCLANVALMGNSVVSLQGNDTGGGYIGPGYTPDATEEAIAHLNAALKLSPQDLSIHQGRLHLLEISGRYGDMAKALDESCTIYTGPDPLEEWLAYAAELFKSGELRADLELLKVLEKHYPNSHEVLGDFGAVYMKLKEDDKAIGYLQRAVELAPDDPIDTWNLGRLYDFTDKTALADEWYQKSIALKQEPEQRRDKTCMYAAFVQKKLNDTKRACELQKSSCDTKDQTACSVSQ